VKNVLITLLLIAIVVLVFGAVNKDQHIDFNYIAGTWHGASSFALAGIGAGVTLFAGLGVAAVARMHVLGGRRKLEKEVEHVYTRLRAAEAASPAAAEASRTAVRMQSAAAGAAKTAGTPTVPATADEQGAPAERVEPGAPAEMRQPSPPAVAAAPAVLATADEPALPAEAEVPGLLAGDDEPPAPADAAAPEGTDQS
jgi:uncharacterized integral membrane protein